MKRKEFLKNSMGLALTLPVGLSLGKSNHNQSPIKEYDVTSWDQIRSYFPLKESLTFLNNGTMGITPTPVLNAVKDSFSRIAENAAYPHHNNELETKLAELIGCDAQEIGITKNVSEGINHIAWGIPLKPGDEVIITTHEHIGGCAAWMRRSQMEGIVIKNIPLGDSDEAFIDILRKHINSKTKVIAIPHIPCTTGQILPVKEICTLAREAGIISVLDGAHPLGMIQFNVKEIGCDYYAGCFHKWMLGPIGTGWMYIRKELLPSTRISHVAAYSVSHFDMSAQPPEMDFPINDCSRYSYGTFSGPHIEGCKAAIEWYQHIGPDRIEKRVKQLQHYLRETLSDAGNKIRVLNNPNEHANGAQLGFQILKTSKEKPNSGFVNYARKNGLILRHVGENNIDCIRVSTHYYNNKSEIDQLFNLLKTYAWS